MEDFFQDGFKPTIGLTIGATACGAGIAASIYMLVDIIRSRKSLPDSSKTLITMLVSSLQWSIVEYLGFVTTTDILRYFYGPLSHNICLLKTTVTPALVIQMLLFTTAILLTRFIFIALMKNPGAVDDQFWTIFLNIWIRLVSYTSQIVSLFSPGSELIVFYLCSGERPEELDKDSVKIKIIQVVLGLFSLVNITVLCYIQVEKAKMSNVSTETVVESVAAFTSDPHNKLELLIVGISCFFLALTAIANSYFNYVDPKSLNVYPHSAILHAFRFGWPLFGASLAIILGYYKKPRFDNVFNVN